MPKRAKRSSDLYAFWTAEPTFSTSFTIIDSVGPGYCAWTPDGHPAILVPLPTAKIPNGRVLGNVRLRGFTSLVFDVGGESWTKSAAVIDCLDPNLLRTFSCVASDIVQHLEQEGPSVSSVREALQAWDELLRRKPRLSDASETGLWGELSVILGSKSPDSMVSAWRGPTGEVADFVGNGCALEVKTSTRQHVHRISHEQATLLGEHLKPYLVSIWVTIDELGGTTLPSLVESVLDSVQDETALRRKLLMAGYHDDHAGEYRKKFHRPDAPRFVPMTSVPRIRTYDEGISGIRYEFDASPLPHLPPSEVSALMSELEGDDDES